VLGTEKASQQDGHTDSIGAVAFLIETRQGPGAARWAAIQTL
jgi:hypothetical protein